MCKFNQGAITHTYSRCLVGSVVVYKINVIIGAVLSFELLFDVSDNYMVVCVVVSSSK